ncbi:coiled-coil domain-containing protein 84 isoform X2 [Xenopus tropicalis]|uniref:Centrosomal AT-AC n=1 Tax=Xenopus tropicalis TaxID=8364 RepID=A0A6I8T0W0_XENTR|nr:coiled-coil domain-containing protein 84 isoform X2 [Xenopus tropicalis]
MVVYECNVCKRSVFTGRRKHVYERSHRERLAGLLKGFSSKVAGARKMIKVASVVKYDSLEHEQRFWCYCCEEEVKRHTSDGTLTVLYGGMLEHMKSPQHKKAVNKFWWIHQAERNLKEQFLLTSEEYERFKSSLIKALENYEETEDVLIKEVAAQIREVESSRFAMLQSLLEVCFLRSNEQYPNQLVHKMPVTQPTGEEEVWSNDAHLTGRATTCIEAVPTDCDEAGPSGINNKALGIPPTGSGPCLTFVGHQEMPVKGNVHTGALPPWMIPDEEDGTEAVQEIGPSFEEFLKQKEKMKLKKLPPNRVGANFDHSSITDEDWLPSFGRVWNSGRRWQSRHQYRSEEGKAAKKKRRDED